MVSLPKFPKIGYMVYGYANARVHGMKGLLLNKETYLELANLKSVVAMAELLQKTHYKKSVLDSSAYYDGIQLIDCASGDHYSTIVKKIKKIAPNEDKPVIDALLMKWDVINLKIVLQSRKITSNFSEVKPKLIAVGSLDLTALESIYKVEEKELLNEIKKTQFGRDLLSQSSKQLGSESWNRFKKAMSVTDIFSEIRVMLDTYSYALMEYYLRPFIHDKYVKALYKLLSEEITTRNILIIERLKQSGIKDEKTISTYLLKGGLMDKIMISNIVKSDNLANLFPLIKRLFPSLKQEKVKDLVTLETELTRARSFERIKFFHKSILSIGNLLGFILLKEEEMNNLRKLALSKEFEIAPKEVIETLLIPGG
ncbi:MAG: V-type ATPase subunit [Candidatus ainarchaeum sp.]|nr:V-type ATPase subunit [Candidatus ainarchaeum sp.]